ncbi:hypothetical protein J2W48_004083 [Flavobacterium piscis]|uniref:Uncharacterized protein n=1 Tax=Flavobacterium piscis TaxID=1114874 RepID=A0ABU1YEZ2_9FLAO|nr:hypothetical protein [Flavobacterium piscis]
MFFENGKGLVSRSITFDERTKKTPDLQNWCLTIKKQ